MKPATTVHFSSRSNEWPTPQWFFDSLNETFKFTLDPCATHENAKCKKYFPAFDWMRKAYLSSLEGATVVCLVPAWTDTKWWHEYAMKGEFTFLKGRLKFGDARASAPFPSALVVFAAELKARSKKQKRRAAALSDRAASQIEQSAFSFS